jgi:hypothetical protein
MRSSRHSKYFVRTSGDVGSGHGWGSAVGVRGELAVEVDAEPGAELTRRC